MAGYGRRPPQDIARKNLYVTAQRGPTAVVDNFTEHRV
jgi:hypothetical protein